MSYLKYSALAFPRTASPLSSIGKLNNLIYIESATTPRPDLSQSNIYKRHIQDFHNVTCAQGKPANSVSSVPKAGTTYRVHLDGKYITNNLTQPPRLNATGNNHISIWYERCWPTDNKIIISSQSNEISKYVIHTYQDNITNLNYNKKSHMYPNNQESIIYI